MSTYIYEDLQPKIERRNTPESHLLLVHIPDGFTRNDVGAKVEYDFGRVRVFGERSIENFKRSRFNQIYQVPSYCNTSNIKGKIDGNIITIIMPIIRGSKVPTQQELDEEDEEASKQKQKEHEESISQKGQQHKEENSAQKEVTPEVNKDSMSQKDQQKEETSSTKESQHDDHETSTPSEEASKDSMSQKGKQEKEASSQSATQVTEVSTPPEANKDSMSQKGNEGIVSDKATFTTEEENTEGLNDHERKSVGKEESKEDQLKKIITEKVKEMKEESKVYSDKVEGFIRKNTEKVKGKFSDDAEKISDKRGIYESTRRRIKDMADSTSQAVTRFTKRSNNEENKQKIIYTAAAILVVGISVYVSFKYRSSRRP